MKWLEHLLVELEVPEPLREQLLARIPAAYPNEQYFETTRDTIHGILRVNQGKNLIAPWCNVGELAAECARYARDNCGLAIGIPVRPPPAPSRLRHTAGASGDCVKWCNACQENVQRGLNPDGTAG